MLRTRVITAVVLVAILLPSLFWASQMAWALGAALVCGIAAWEWAAFIAVRQRLVFGGLTALFCAGLAVFVPAIAELSDPQAVAWIYGGAALFWLLLVPLWLRYQWPLRGLKGMLLGWVVIVPAWLALVQLRLLGPEVLLAILAVVWVADIAAYFFGKTFGKHKLAPSVSPGKTWEGAIGAGVTVVCYGLVLRHFLTADGGSLLVWLVGLVLVTAVSILGDLFESLLKRKAGLKDSSQILPGHGGVMDRIDSLTSTLPVVAFLWLFSSLHSL